MEENKAAEPELIEGIDDDDDLDAEPPESNYRPHDFIEAYIAAQTAKKPLKQFPKLFREALSVVWEADRRRFLLITFFGIITGTGLGLQLVKGRDAVRGGAGRTCRR